MSRNTLEVETQEKSWASWLGLCTQSIAMLSSANLATIDILVVSVLCLNRHATHLCSLGNRDLETLLAAILPDPTGTRYLMPYHAQQQILRRIPHQKFRLS
jgi:hypothetical protein